MAIRVALSHRTSYRFDRLVKDERQRDLVIVEMQPVHARHQRRPCGAQL